MPESRPLSYASKIFFSTAFASFASDTIESKFEVLLLLVGHLLPLCPFVQPFKFVLGQTHRHIDFDIGCNGRPNRFVVLGVCGLECRVGSQKLISQFVVIFLGERVFTCRLLCLLLEFFFRKV
jgi:hypothetical protein